MARSKNSKVSPWKSWTIAKLRSELKNHGIKAPTWCKRAALIATYEKKVGRYAKTPDSSSTSNDNNTHNLRKRGQNTSNQGPSTPDELARSVQVERDTNISISPAYEANNSDVLLEAYSLNDAQGHAHAGPRPTMAPEELIREVLHLRNELSSIKQSMQRDEVGAEGNSPTLCTRHDGGVSFHNSQTSSANQDAVLLQQTNGGYPSNLFTSNRLNNDNHYSNNLHEAHLLPSSHSFNTNVNVASYRNGEDTRAQSANQNTANCHLTPQRIPNIRQAETPEGYRGHVYQQTPRGLMTTHIDNSEFNLLSAYNNGDIPTPTYTVSRPGRLMNGAASDSLPFVEIVSPQLRRDIILGKNINLPSLLIPGAKSGDSDLTNRSILIGEETIPLKPLTDPRLQKNLTIQEFITAFTIYRNIMCSTFPDRREELDAYLRDIIDMSTKFGGFSFYEYHKAFSARAAAILNAYNIKLDWSRRDNNLFCSIFAGHKANACTICNSLSHSTDFCSLAQHKTSNSQRFRPYENPKPWGSAPRNDNVDRKGRARITYQGKEICNDFNSESGCGRPSCRFSHNCASCFKVGHKAINGKCSQGSGSPQGIKTGGPTQTQNTQ